MTLTERLLVVIDAKSDGLARELGQVRRDAKATESSFESFSRSLGLSGASLKTGLVAGATALVGTGLVSFLKQSATAFTESQNSAAQWARATNATVAEAGKFTLVAKTLGLGMNDLIEINAEFSRKIQQQPQLLRQLNVEVQKNADGTVNMTKTLVKTLDALGQMEDGLKAAQIAAQLFGEEGSKQLAGFYLQGIKVSELMERIDFVDQSDSAKKFAASTIEMSLAFEQLKISVGSNLVPVLTQGADALTSIINVVSGIPKETFIAAAGFVALRKGVEVFGPAISREWGALATTLTGLGQAASDAGGKAALAGKGFAALVKAAGPLIVFTALTSAVTAYVTASREVKDISVDIGKTTLSLREQAEQVVKTDSVWRTLLYSDNDIDATMRDITKSVRDQAKAMLENKDATDAERQSAQNLLDVLGDGTLEQQKNNLATERGRQAQDQFANALSRTEAAVSKAATSMRSLDDAALALLQNDPTASFEELASAARQAADDQALLEAKTELVAEAMALATRDTGFFIERLMELESFNGSGLESLKQQLTQISLVDDPDTGWVNEYIIGAEQAGDAIQTYLISAFEKDPNFDATAFFASLRAGAPPEIVKIIDAIEAQFNADGGITATVGAKPDGTVDQTKTLVDELGNPIEAPFVVLENTEAIASARAQREALAAGIETDVVVNTSFAPGGFEAVKARSDYLAQTRRGNVDIDVEYGPGGYNAVKARKDFLTRTASGRVNIDVDFRPGSYADIMARINNIARNRSATITVNTVTRGGATQQSLGYSAAGPMRISISGREVSYIVEDALQRSRDAQALQDILGGVL